MAPAGDHLDPRPARLHLSRARSLEALPELGRPAGRAAHVFIRYSGVADAERERLARRPRRLRVWFNEAVPEDAPYWTHTSRAPTTCGAHQGLAARLVADAPGAQRRLALGTWQGIYLCGSTATTAAPGSKATLASPGE